MVSGNWNAIGSWDKSGWLEVWEQALCIVCDALLGSGFN